MHPPGHRSACRSGEFSPSGQAAGLPLHQESPPDRNPGEELEGKVADVQSHRTRQADQ